MTMAEPDDDLPVPTHDESIMRLVKSLINGEVAASTSAHGGTERERLRNHMKARADDTVMGSITGLSAWLTARAADRQATAMESLAKTASRWSMAESVDTNAQAMVDQREPKRDYLATTYSLSPTTLSLLWAMRGMVMDASVKSLSRPDRFDPYRRLTTAEIAWSLRLTPEQLIVELPRIDGSDGKIDYGLLEEFDIMHYGGTPEQPDDWMYGG